jgi:hypothetical protein
VAPGITLGAARCCAIDTTTVPSMAVAARPLPHREGTQPGRPGRPTIKTERDDDEDRDGHDALTAGLALTDAPGRRGTRGGCAAGRPRGRQEVSGLLSERLYQGLPRARRDPEAGSLAGRQVHLCGRHRRRVRLQSQPAIVHQGADESADQARGRRCGPSQRRRQ